MHNEKDYILVVDGYNIINSWASLKRIQELSLDDAREKLIDYMAEYKSMSQENVVIVFDSYKKKGSVRSYHKRKGIEVIYTEENETADHLIERMVSEKKKYQVYRVASSDAIIQNIVFGRGATRISANELYLEYKGKKSSTLKRTKYQKSKKNRNIVELDSKQIKKLEEFEKLLKEDEK